MQHRHSTVAPQQTTQTASSPPQDCQQPLHWYATLWALAPPPLQPFFCFSLSEKRRKQKKNLPATAAASRICQGFPKAHHYFAAAFHQMNFLFLFSSVSFSNFITRIIWHLLSSLISGV
jgi:hypothetical protein